MTVTVSQVIGRLESNDDYKALRFEPDYEWLNLEIVNRCRRAHEPSIINHTTANALCRFSYGRFQIMGGLLYEYGFSVPLRDFLSSPSIQQIWFEEVLNKKEINFSLDELMNDDNKLLKFAHRYNGDKSGVYAARIKMIANQLILQDGAK